MHILIKYEKGEEVRFISHLEMLRTMQRILRRCQLPLRWSKGFNPHPVMSFASATAVGTLSDDEYLDIYFDLDISINGLTEKLNAVSPVGIKFMSTDEIAEKMPSLTAMLETANYDISVYFDKKEDYNNAVNAIKGFLEMNEIITTKRSKKGFREIDLKPMIKSMSIKSHDDDNLCIVIDAFLPMGSKMNLSPKLLMGAYLKYSNVEDKDADYFCHRTKTGFIYDVIEKWGVEEF